ncbi:MAG: DUF3037 domain-containing protein [Ferruginibacter sp.]
MQDNHLFEYAVIRVMPRVEREEFLNVGVVLYCAKLNFLKALIRQDDNRLRSFFKEIDVQEIDDNLHAFERICEGGPESGPIGRLDIAGRFRWLTATRSTVVQTSKVHPGFCKDASEKILQLFNQLVI